MPTLLQNNRNSTSEIDLLVAKELDHDLGLVEEVVGEVEDMEEGVEAEEGAKLAR